MVRSKHVALARDWYEGRQNEIPVQSVHVEDHQFLSDECGKRYAACLMTGFRGQSIIIDGVPRTGGNGLIDMRTGIMGVRVTKSYEHWRTEDGLVLTFCAILNGECGAAPAASASSRYRICVERSRKTGLMEANLYDTKGRAKSDPRHLCSIGTGKAPSRSDLEPLERIAGALHHGKLDWSKIRRGEPGLEAGAEVSAR